MAQARNESGCNMNSKIIIIIIIIIIKKESIFPRVHFSREKGGERIPET